MAPRSRVTPRVVVRKLVRNRSSRRGVRPTLIVIHSTESDNRPGTSDLAAVAGWFDNPSSQASSTVIVDAEGQSARCVPDSEKPWTQAHYNSVSLSIECIGRAAQTAWTADEVREAARWIALWSVRHGIPIRKGRVDSSGRVVRSGVLRHSELGALGGNHHDPGRAFPLRSCLRLARYYRAQRRKR